MNEWLKNTPIEHFDKSQEKVRRKARLDEDVDRSHPAFRQLSKENGLINRMAKHELKTKLRALDLHDKGEISILRVRYKNNFRLKVLKSSKLACEFNKSTPDVLCVIDFECTCEKDIRDYPHEIIEFPAVIIDTRTRKIMGEFHSYCRPVLNPVLTKFCVELTGISQECVCAAEPFDQVLSRFEAWLGAHIPAGDESSFLMVTDGPTDFRGFLRSECTRSSIPLPAWADEWCDLKLAFKNNYHFKDRDQLMGMMTKLDLSPEGRLHCGLDDAKNIARVVLEMLTDGCELRANRTIDPPPRPDASDPQDEEACSSVAQLAVE